MAVLPPRKSLIKTRANLRRSARNYNTQRNFDEKHFQILNESIRDLSDESESKAEGEVSELEQKLQKISERNLEIVTEIRKRGENAKMKRTRKTLKTNYDQKLYQTPQNKDKMSPIYFPEFSSEKKESGTPQIFSDKHEEVKIEKEQSTLPVV